MMKTAAIKKVACDTCSYCSHCDRRGICCDHLQYGGYIEREEMIDIVRNEGPCRGYRAADY